MLRRYGFVVVMLISLWLPQAYAAETNFYPETKWQPFFLSVDSAKLFGENVLADYKNFYSKNSLIKLTVGVAGAAILANTNLDQSTANWWQGDVRSHFTNNFSRAFKPFGTNEYVLLGYIGITGVALTTRKTEFGNILGIFSQKYLETLLVGVPPVLIGQVLLGGDRPSGTNGSHWHSFRDDHGVSGHAFLGALPFLTAAHLTDRTWLKCLFYTASTFTGISRINDNQHYLSQVILGYGIAFLSSDAVFNSNHRNFQITPLATPGGAGIQLSMNF